MEYCIAPASQYFSLQNLIYNLFHRFFSFLMARNDMHQEQTLDREGINQQAERMLAEYGNSILRLAYTYLHNLSDAEEILQDTLIQFLKTAPVLDGPAHEKAWLLRVAANLSRNRLDYNRTRQADELKEELIAEDRKDLPREGWQSMRIWEYCPFTLSRYCRRIVSRLIAFTSDTSMPDS